MLMLMRHHDNSFLLELLHFACDTLPIREKIAQFHVRQERIVTTTYYLASMKYWGFSTLTRTLCARRSSDVQ